MIQYAFYRSPVGLLKIGCENERVIFLQRVEKADSPDCPSPLSDCVVEQLSEYLHGKRQILNIPFQLKGTEFQRAVWRAIYKIPYGETRTYGEIAAAIGRPRACRAVGTACRCNLVWLIVPCHRVIGAGGRVSGYAGGSDMKRILLDLESSTACYELRNS